MTFRKRGGRKLVVTPDGAEWARKLKEGEVTAEFYGFLTTAPNAVIGAVHPQAMPVILTTEDEVDRWLTAPTPEALRLQRPLPDDALRIVARGEKEDSVFSAAAL